MQNIQNILTDWYKTNKRDLPFRNESDPYKIWVSEIMLQQTTVKAVIPCYKRFMDACPGVAELAAKSDEEVYKLWEGLGYYRRARHLHESAKYIMNELGGEMPKDYESALKLKGVGAYTAAAISSFAWHEPRAAVDGNALRVVARITGLRDNIAEEKTKKKVTDIMNGWMDGVDSAALNQGVMDFANAVCLPKHPHCEDCPLTTHCHAYNHHETDVLPVNIKKIKRKEARYVTGIITYENQILLVKNAEGLLENMYGLVQYECESPFSFCEAFAEDFGVTLTPVDDLGEFKHVFTHRTWHMHVYHFVLSKPLDGLMSLKQAQDKPVATAHKKILTSFFS